MLSIHTSPYFCFYTTWGNVIRISRHSTTRFVNRTSSNTFSLLKMRFLKIFLNHFLQFYSKCLLCCRLPMCTISSQSLPPLAVSCVNKVFFAVVQSRLFNQSLFEFVQIIDTNLVYTLLHDAPNLVVFGSVRGCLAATDQYSDEVGGIALQQLSGLTGAEGQRAISICYYRSLINWIIYYYK